MNYFKKENYLNFGLILIILSTALFLIEPESFKESSNFFTFLFFVHYSLPIVYCLVLKNAFDRGFFSLFGSEIYSGHLLLLVLFNISAFSLNREIAIFYESATWLTVLLVFENSLLIFIAFLKEVPKWLRAVLILGAPIFLLIHLHQTFIILPMSFFGFIGGLFLGVGLLLFVPVFYMTAIIRILRNLDFSIQDLRLVSISTLAVATVIVYHFFTWKNIDERIQNGYLDVDTPFHKSELPTWVAISKNIKSDYLTEAYLKSDLVYQKYEKFGFFAPDFGSIDEKKIHDPLITICMGSNQKQAMDEESRIKVLNFLYDKRHQTADRFWRGDHLTTDQVVTNIQVFPEERLTYSELILTISNNDRRNRWRPQEEAVYTFQLPEGGVITSLSLWIEGKEEKAILTRKSKAETAYNTIVGREMRDPSVIYWMEGNKARIRVFPCTPDENRKFKVGVTAPLKLEAGHCFMNQSPLTDQISQKPGLQSILSQMVPRLTPSSPLRSIMISFRGREVILLPGHSRLKVNLHLKCHFHSWTSLLFQKRLRINSVHLIQKLFT
jgi:XrtN system VIT domain protein